jgi:hypothetical protein
MSEASSQSALIVFYACGDYFGSMLASQGLWDEAAQLWLIVPAAEAQQHQEMDFLEVGRPGVDGILFGYRKGRPGFWAFYPIEREFQLLAENIQAFLKGWDEGRITV